MCQEEEVPTLQPAQPQPQPPQVEPATSDDCGLGVAQIVITAATPMVEEPEKPFPPPAPDSQQEAFEDEESSLSEQTALCLQEEPKDSPLPASSSTDGESTETSGTPTAPQSPPAAPRAGRASIPDELEPAQLAKLTDLKESNA